MLADKKNMFVSENTSNVIGWYTVQPIDFYFLSLHVKIKPWPTIAWNIFALLITQYIASVYIKLNT